MGKITTRKAYASFKTSVFLRSLNVKESASEYVVNEYMPRTNVSATDTLAFPRTPKYGVNLRHYQNSHKYGMV
jgi:hypothetical protein